MTEKPGIQTTEFWIAIMPYILAVGVLILIGLGRADNDLLMLVLSLLGIGGSYASGQYSRSRGNVKASVIEAESARQTAIIEAETAQAIEAAKWTGE